MILFKFVFHKSFGRNRCEKILTWNVRTILSPFCPVFFWLVEFCCSRIKTKREDLFSQQAACKLQAQPLSSYQNPEKNNNNNKTLQNQQSFFGRPGAVVEDPIFLWAKKNWPKVRLNFVENCKSNFNPCWKIQFRYKIWYYAACPTFFQQSNST